MTGGDLAALHAVLGPESLLEHEPLPLAGARPTATLAPADGEELASALRVLAERNLAALLCGAGSQLALGNPVRRADVVLTTRRLGGILELDAEEGILQARAGTPVAALREAARGIGWEPALDPPGEAATLGGTLAVAACGPRSLGLGRPRDGVLGLELAHPGGVRTRCGGRVVKNVTGYDLAKLYLGSLGTLAVIETAWLRLRPLPECLRGVAAALAPGAGALDRALAAARLAAARSALLLDAALAEKLAVPAPQGGFALLVELAGDEAVVARDAAALADACGAGEAPPGAIDRARALQWRGEGPAELRFRVSALPSRLAAAAAPLQRAGAALLVHPGLGLLLARFALEPDADEGAIDAGFRAAGAAAREGGGSFLLESGPDWAKQGRDVFGDPPEGLALMREVKQRFDPAGLLNPGRFVGRI